MDRKRRNLKVLHFKTQKPFRIEKLEFFDEFEEWELILRHYFVLWSFKGEEKDWKELETKLGLGNLQETKSKKTLLAFD
jgi:hypothetical protein